MDRSLRVNRSLGLRALALLTLVLIGLGSYVRATGAGLSCPDWPLCFGRAVPEFTYGVTQEVVHRYIAGIVLLLCCFFAWRGFQNRHLEPRFFRFSVSILLLVIVQAVFGGLTVTMKLNPFVVTTHLALGTLFFQSVFLGSFSQSRGVDEVPRPLKGLLLLLSVLIFLQILVGGFVGASGASLACPDFPNCGAPLHGPQHLQLTHRVLGFTLLGVFLLSASYSSKLEGVTRKKIHGGILRTAALITLQILVGWMNLLYLIPPLVTVVHVVLAQGILLHALLLWWRAKPQEVAERKGKLVASQPA